MYSIEELRWRDSDGLYQIYDPEVGAERLQEFDGYLAAGPAEVEVGEDGRVCAVVIGRMALEMIGSAFDDLAAFGEGPDWRLRFDRWGACVVRQHSTGRGWRVPLAGGGYDVSALPWRWTRVDDDRAEGLVPVMQGWHGPALTERGTPRRALRGFDRSDLGTSAAQGGGAGPVGL